MSNRSTAMLGSPSPSEQESHEAERLTEAVVATVAEEEGVSPLELRPLAAAIDPDALNAIFRPGSDGTISFTYHGYRVRASGDGDVSIAEGDT